MDSSDIFYHLEAISKFDLTALSSMEYSTVFSEFQDLHTRIKAEDERRKKTYRVSLDDVRKRFPTEGYSVPLAELKEVYGLNLMVFNALTRHEYRNVQDILTSSEADLLRIRHFGPGCLRHLCDVLSKVKRRYTKI